MNFPQDEIITYLELTKHIIHLLLGEKEITKKTTQTIKYITSSSVI
jgi:hypothetical protein